jgi:hypothetical protein
MNLLHEIPSAQVREAAAARTLGEASYYDLLSNTLQRAKGVAGLIGSAAFSPNNMNPADISEAGYLVADELDKALILLDGLFAEARSVGAGGG